MNKLIASSFLILMMPVAANAALIFSDNTLPVIEIKPAPSTGLEMIYVLGECEGAGVSFTTPGISWQTFGSGGGAYAEDVIPDGQSIRLKAGDTGLIVNDGGRQHCYWVVDYSAHALILNGLSVAPDQGDCTYTSLALDGEAEAIPFYTVTGRRDLLGRELKISYDTQIFDEESFCYNSTTVESTLDGAGAVFGVEAPLADTRFTLSGDRFLRFWGKEMSVVSDAYHTTALAAETKAAQTARENDNEQKEDANGALGGSAPCEIEFSAALSDGVAFKEWQISGSGDFSVPENTFNEETVTYTFTESGTYYVRFIANNESGTCEYIGTTYEVFVGESKLDIPNAFSPGASPGVNDEWKVSYRSIVEFECHIFNRWGTKMCSMTDPSQGWDGKYRGKLVPAGTYYYVIKAKGSDGVEYKKSGDINIINYSSDASQSTGETDNTDE